MLARLMRSFWNLTVVPNFGRHKQEGSLDLERKGRRRIHVWEILI
jgi:hypothetical protein